MISMISYLLAIIFQQVVSEPMVRRDTIKSDGNRAERRSPKYGAQETRGMRVARARARTHLVMMCAQGGVGSRSGGTQAPRTAQGGATQTCTWFAVADTRRHVVWWSWLRWSNSEGVVNPARVTT